MTKLCGIAHYANVLRSRGYVPDPMAYMPTSPTFKLSASDIREIMSGGCSAREFAERFDVTARTIHRVRARLRYATTVRLEHAR